MDTDVAAAFEDDDYSDMEEENVRNFLAANLQMQVDRSL
jgi:hypothetical protein